MKRLNLLLLCLFLVSCTSNQPETQKKEINKFYQQAVYYRNNGQIDSALTYFIKAEDLALIKKDSLIVGQSLINQAIFYTNGGDYLNGQKISFKALSYLKKEKEENHSSLSSNYNNLGIATQNLRDYENAIKFYDLAIKFSKDANDSNKYYNNKAYLFQITKQYKKAIQTYTQLEKLTGKDETDYARALANMSFTKWLENQDYNPLPELLKVLKIRKKEKNLADLNSSYSYLSDYYTKSNPDSALFYAYQMYEVAQKLTIADDQLYALQKLIRLSPTPLFLRKR